MRQSLISATGWGSCALENVKLNMSQSVYVSGCERKITQKRPATYANTEPRDDGCDSGWPGSATESLWAMFLMGHSGEEPGEQRRKAKVSPGDKAKLINIHSSINNRPPGSGRKLQSSANNCSVTVRHSITAPLTTSDL